jgi:hypothetical protein
MESNEHKDGFEIFLKEKADSYKMYPSEKVWANLNEQLHPRKKWPYFVVAAIFLGLGFGGKIYDTRYTSFNASQAKPPVLTAEKEILTANVATGKEDKLVLSKNGIDTRHNKDKNSFDLSAIVKADKEINDTRASVIQMRPHQPAPDQESKVSDNTPETGTLIFTSAIDEQGLSTKSPTLPTANPGKVIVMSTIPGLTVGSGTVASAFKHDDPLHPSYHSKTVESQNGMNKGLSAIQTKENSSSIKDLTNPATITENTMDGNAPAVIKVKKPKINSLGWQLYFSPTISYRNIYGTVNKNSYSNAMMFSSLPGSPKDINSAVSHSPSIGMELGTAMIYNIGKRFRIKGGLQFNYSQYNIIAYNYTAEIAPLSAAGIGHTEIKALSYHRNFDGYSLTRLSNEHFGISMPIGLELAVLGNKDVQFNIAGTLQPGLMLNNQAYMLSTNLRNYAKVPSLYKNFNVNSAVEAFLTINMGSVKWNMGPQIRYQLLSSYKQNYPIKEHLYDYGFKVGMTKTIR